MCLTDPENRHKYSATEIIKTWESTHGSREASLLAVPDKNTEPVTVASYFKSLPALDFPIAFRLVKLYFSLF